jgi:hypothetical protein
VPPQHPCHRFPGPRWPAPASPRRAAAARATTPPASSCSRTTTPSSGPRAHPGAPHTLTLAFAHAHFAHFSLSRPPHLTGPPPQPVAAVASRPRRLPPAIQCSSSTVATPCSLLTHPISLFRTRASSPAALVSSSSAAARPRRRPDATPPLSLRQGHH